MDFTNESSEDDQVFEQDDLKIATNKKSLLYLVGTELDYTDGLNGKGFEWKNPQASRVCGCGESFSL
jgi:iron-sulfur cluster assembly protein